MLLAAAEGTGESGKSTIVRQMKIIHQDGYTRDELLGYRETVYNNILQSCMQVCDAMSTLQVAFETQAARDAATYFAAQNLSSRLEQAEFAGKIAPGVKALVQDSGVQVALERSREFYLLDSAP